MKINNVACKHHMVSLLIIALLSASPCYAENNKSIENIIGNFGTDFIVEFILENRFGQITVNQGGTLSDVWGRPNKDLIDYRSIGRDFEKIGMSLTDVEEALAQRKTSLKEKQNATPKNQNDPQSYAPSKPSQMNGHIESVKAKLKDPDSAQFSMIRSGSGITCGYVNARNSYGGYSGDERFVVINVGGRQHVLIGKDVSGTQIEANGVWISADPYVQSCFSRPVVAQ